MANTEKISSIFKDIRKKVQKHVYIPPTVMKNNSILIQEDETIILTKKK